jgi:hypothetical protein
MPINYKARIKFGDYSRKLYSFNAQLLIFMLYIRILSNSDFLSGSKINILDPGPLEPKKWSTSLIKRILPTKNTKPHFLLFTI